MVSHAKLTRNFPDVSVGRGQSTWNRNSLCVKAVAESSIIGDNDEVGDMNKNPPRHPPMLSSNNRHICAVRVLDKLHGGILKI